MVKLALDAAENFHPCCARLFLARCFRNKRFIICLDFRELRDLRFFHTLPQWLDFLDLTLRLLADLFLAQYFFECLLLWERRRGALAL